jgi:predicted neutral ceramidase superfamily lipid hydrolase
MKMDVFKRFDLKSFLIFAVIAAFAFFAASHLNPYITNIGYIILVIELMIVVTVTWGLAVHAVIKSLFGVSAGLSLIIFLAQSYCQVPLASQTANDSLKSLVAFGLIYIGVEFFRSIYKEATGRAKTLKEANDNKRPWLMMIPFALFTGLFIWQVVQVLLPIIQNLCVYK